MLSKRDWFMCRSPFSLSLSLRETYDKERPGRALLSMLRQQWRAQRRAAPTHAQLYTPRSAVVHFLLELFDIDELVARVFGGQQKLVERERAALHVNVLDIATWRRAPVDRSERYLFRSHSRVELRGWAERLRYFRFYRAVGGLANDGGVYYSVTEADVAHAEVLEALLEKVADRIVAPATHPDFWT